jgi:hypothetical protein
VFQTTAFGVAACLTPFPLALAMAAVVWRTIGFPYYGNMLIYPNFTGASLIPGVTVTLAALVQFLDARYV